MRAVIIAMFIMGLWSCSPQKQEAPPVTLGTMEPSRELMLTESQIKLANITTQVVKPQDISQTVPVNGRLVANEELTEVISSRATGRIERLYIKEVGRLVNKGEPLYELYSESLLTLQREYILALEQYASMKEVDKRYESYLSSARKKLLLYGMTDNQIDQLKRVEDIHSRITFLATASGIVKQLNVAEGQYINEGDVLYQLENTKQLWVEAELYPSELNLVRIGDQVVVSVQGNENASAKIIFLSPEYRSDTQITVMRALVSNSTLQWKPGMQVQVYIKHHEKTSLAVPVDAVIHDQRGEHVYIQSATNTFVPRKVKTGMENFAMVEIMEGVKEGETIVISGAYLLYSEMVLRNGHDPMVTHQHVSN